MFKNFVELGEIMKKELEVGQNLTMYFNLGGMTSDEETEIVEITDNYIFLKRDEEREWKFSKKSGKCMNDNTEMGASRTIDIIVD